MAMCVICVSKAKGSTVKWCKYAQCENYVNTLARPAFSQIVLRMKVVSYVIHAPTYDVFTEYIQCSVIDDRILPLDKMYPSLFIQNIGL